MTSPARPLPSLAATVAKLLQLPSPASAASEAVAEVVAELGTVSRVALLAPDALGRHPFALWRQEMPFLSSLHDRRSLTLRSIMPSITPVNFTKCAILRNCTTTAARPTGTRPDRTGAAWSY